MFFGKVCGNRRARNTLSSTEGIPFPAMYDLLAFQAQAVEVDGTGRFEGE